MPIRKSIRDIQTSNIISDMVSEEPINKIKVTKVNNIVEKIPEETSIPSEKIDKPVKEQFETTLDKPLKSNNSDESNASKFKKFFRILSQIKTVYLIAFGIILLGVAVLIFIPSNTQKNPLEQSKKEAEVVKKQFSKHIILPENEQIDIRKITNKMEDPFFKDAEVGDYLIIFYKNRIAFIYSVDKDIIVNAGVVFIDPKTATTTGSTTKKQ